jgi:FkbM family methyltransferase
MGSKFKRLFSKKAFAYAKYVPPIIMNIENWFEFILNYSKVKDESVEYRFRNGLKLKTNEGVDSTTIAVIFIRKDYGDLGNKKTIIDIGANIGVFSIFAANSQKNSHVYAYEPMSDSYDLLEENIKLNGMEDRVHAFKQGVSGKREKRELFLGAGSPFHSLYPKKGDEKTLEIQCVTLEDIFEKNKIRQCDLLKMDCEGAEFEIIYNTNSEYLDRIREIKLEYHCFEKGQSIQDLINFLREKGFRLTKFKKTTASVGDAWFEKDL